VLLSPCGIQAAPIINNFGLTSQLTRSLLMRSISLKYCYRHSVCSLWHNLHLIVVYDIQGIATFPGITNNYLGNFDINSLVNPFPFSFQRNNRKLHLAWRLTCTDDFPQLFLTVRPLNPFRSPRHLTIQIQVFMILRYYFQ